MKQTTINPTGLGEERQSVEPTPRPWQAATTAKRGTWTIYQQGTPRTIATLPNDVKRDFNTGEANARLIVKAVNSHDALVKALNDLIELNYAHTCKHHGPMICDKCEALANGAKALACARGEIKVTA